MTNGKFAKKIARIVCICVLCCVCFGAFAPLFGLWKDGRKDVARVEKPLVQNAENTTDGEETATPKDFQITFYSVGNGDCAIAKYKDTEMLIDCGEKTGSSSVFLTDTGLIEELKKVCTDKILEYLVVTHGDSDHLGNTQKLLQSFRVQGEELSQYTLKKIVDFDREEHEGLYTAGVYTKYVSERNKLVKEKDTAYVPISSLFSNRNADNAFEPFDEEKEGYSERFGDGTDAPILHFLYNPYYFLSEIKDMYKNSVSVCLAMEYGQSKILLTGDMEEYNQGQKVHLAGETALTQNYKKLFASGVTVFKAAHHGSESSNSRALVSAIKPKNVVISALANSEDSVNKYWGFPKQEVLDTFLAATDNVYITSRYDADTGNSYQYYGHITFKMDRAENVELHCSNYASDSIPQLTKTVWFQENRAVSLQTFVFSGYESANKAYLGNCTLIQRGKTDILIDCGNYPDVTADYSSDHFVRKVAQYCLDGVLEYVIVTSPSLYAYSQICDPDGDKKGILSTFDVQTLIDYGKSNDPSQNAKVSVYKKYNEAKAAFVAESGNEYKTAKECVGETIDLGDGLSIEILDNEYYDELGEEEYENVVCTMIHYHDRKLLFTGNIGEKGEESIAEHNELSGTDFFLASDFGSNAANSETLLDEIKNEGLFIAVGGVAGEDFIRTPLPKKVACRFHDKYSKNTFITASRDENGEYTDVMGDLVFAVRKKGDKTMCSVRGTHEKARSEKEMSAFQLCNTQYYKSL